MTQPFVVAICLTRDRPEMLKRAVRCFQAQKYERKRMYIYDTGVPPTMESPTDGFSDHAIVYKCGLRYTVATIGELRNIANWWAVRPYSGADPDCDIIVHFDDDDYSHPNRITEQVALLQASGKQCVGYREMLFWRTDPGEAWLWNHPHPSHCVGTSLCYWRSFWERKPFTDQPRPGAMGGEYAHWLNGDASLGVSSLSAQVVGKTAPDGEPRLIASIHGGNTSGQYADIEKSSSWKRVPEFDQRVREIMENA